MSVCRCVVVALVLALAMSAQASADVAKDTAGTVLPIGSGFNATSPNVTITGTFFGVPTTIRCSAWNVTGSVTQNNVAGQPVKFTISSSAFVGCTNQLGTPCNVTTLGLPWNNSAVHTAVGTTLTTSIVVPTGSGQGISISGCLYGNTCVFGGSPAGSTGNSSGGTNPAITSFSSATLTSVSGGCGSALLTATDNWRTGTTIGSGLGIVLSDS